MDEKTSVLKMLLKNKIIFLAVLSALSASSCLICPFPRGDNYVERRNPEFHTGQMIKTGRINTGFSKNEVVGALGTPGKIEMNSDRPGKQESWYYSGGRYRRVDFSGGRVTGWR